MGDADFMCRPYYGVVGNYQAAQRDRSRNARRSKDTITPPVPHGAKLGPCVTIPSAVTLSIVKTYIAFVHSLDKVLVAI